MIRRACRTLFAAGLLAAGARAAAGPLDDARAALAADRYPAAVAFARDALAGAPDDLAAWRVHAAALAGLGAYRDALDAYRRVIALSAESELAARMAAAKLAGRLGDAAAADAQVDAVLAHARAAVRPLPVAELIAVGDAWQHRARRDPALYRAALERYEAAIRSAPDNPRGHVAIGRLLLDRYNNTEALEAFRAALAVAPEDIDALQGLAASQRFDRSPATAETARGILERQPQHVPARVLLARLLIENENYPGAEREVRRALAVDPNAPEALTLLAALHYLRDERARFDAALGALRAATPGYTDAYETLAEIAAQNRRYRDALEFASAAVALDPRAWRAHALVGENRLRLGRMAAGRESMETAFRGDPYNVRTKNTLDLLDRLADFAEHRSARFVLVASPGEAAVLAPRLLPLAERAYDFFAGRYDHRAPTPIRIEVYPDHRDFSVRTVGLVGVDIAGVSFGPVIALDSPSSDAFDHMNWASTVWHEIAHSFHLSLSASRVPRWFTEGLAVYEEHRAEAGWGQDVSPGFLRAFHEGRLARPSELNAAFLRPSYPQQVHHAYFQAALSMEMIEARHGFAAIAAMLRGYTAGKRTAELLEEVLGTTPEAFDRDFEAFVAARYRDSLAGLFGGEDDAAAEPATSYPALLEAGRAALAEGDAETALERFERARALFPDHGGPGSAWRALARAHERRGDLPAAIAALERSVAIDADDLEGHRELARLLAVAGDRERALAVLERALQIEPFAPALHARIAELHEARAAWRAAVESRRAVLALEPPDPVGARYRLARALSRAGEPHAARLTLLRALEAAPLYEEGLELLLEVRAQLAAEAGGEPPDRNAGQ